ALNAYILVGLVAVAVLVVSLVFDDLFEGLTDALGGPDWLSLPVVAALVAGFGFVAGAVAGLGGVTVLALGAGVAGGGLTAWLAARLVVAAMRMPTDPPVRHDQLYGRTGRIVTPIPAGRRGEVLIELAGVRHKVAATAEVPIGLGAEVVVVEVISPTSVVVAILDLDQPDRYEGANS
ncbi:MAG: hypothetical protein ACRD29_16820, partial [Acidimicrobiales bacterium]